MKLEYNDEKYDMCLTKKQIRHFKSETNLILPGKIINEYWFLVLVFLFVDLRNKTKWVLFLG